jgi:NAD-dependent SIR2 family protein deacetylase
MEKNIEKAKEAIRECDYLVITAGMGIGVDSGLPDLRDLNGFWQAYPNAKKLGIELRRFATPSCFDKKPYMAWAFYGDILNLYRETKPHKGFNLLLEIAKSKKDYFVVTTTIDGHFQKAGFSEDKIKELRGSIHYLQCQKLNCGSGIWSADGIDIEVDMDKFKAKQPIPHCSKCSRVARPNIFLLDDQNWKEERSNAQNVNLKFFLDKIRGSSLTVIEIGASKTVPIIKYFSEDLRNNFGGNLIRINVKDKLESEDAIITIPLRAKEAIEKIAS